MSDRYSQLIRTPIGKFVAGNVGLPQPVALERHEEGQPVVTGKVLLGGSGAGDAGAVVAAAAQALADVGAQVDTALEGAARKAAARAGLDAGIWNDQNAGEQRYKALVFDASGISSAEGLSALRDFFQPTIRRVQNSGRVIVLGRPPETLDDPKAQTAQRALEGFTRSVGKEVRRGASSNLVYVEEGAEDQLESTLRFLLSPRSAYVSGQVVRIGPSDQRPAIDWDQPLAGKVALVTGASRGIGAAIAQVLQRDGAHVVGLDVPALEDDLKSVTEDHIAIDITDENAPQTIAGTLKKRHKGVDIVVHNAGVTRDKTLGRMDEERWDLLMRINLVAPERINAALLPILNEGGRIVGVASISGIAGNSGQTNYATSKAGVIGMIQAMAPAMKGRGATINAVAPGFIETAMTAAMPVTIREAGRRMNSMSQGGLPVDVAETIAWFASPGSSGVNGNVVRVCGQSLIGA
jgi:3-oxoacyl-[acyl-carrier protein] reductase